jgi:3',5'-cyclic AMP phosphodiesterase CpdA
VADADGVRLLHVADVHFGRPCIPSVVDAMEAHFHAGRYDAVVIAGDVAQRSLSGEFQRAAAFLRDVRRTTPVLIIPGNHDVAWWESPFHLRGMDPMYTRYRRYISAELEPSLRIPGASLIGVNTSHGLALYTLTTRLRDLSIIGVVTDAQLERVDAACAAAPAGDVRIVVMHHNPVRGQLSNRFGIRHPEHVLARYAAAGVELVLCGHDHQENVQQLSRHRGMVVCTAGTLSDRSRGGRPCSFFDITVSSTTIGVVTQFWDAGRQCFVGAEPQCFERSSRA